MDQVKTDHKDIESQYVVILHQQIAHIMTLRELFMKNWLRKLWLLQRNSMVLIWFIMIFGDLKLNKCMENTTLKEFDYYKL